MRPFRRLFGGGFGPLRVALSYATFGALWILLSDAIALRLVTDDASLPVVQTVKGLFYIAITTALVYGLVRYSTRRMRESEARFREMAENMQDVFYNYDPVREKLLFAGRGYESIWGLPMERILTDPMSFLDSVHPDDREAVMAAHHRNAAGDSTETEFRVIRPDGSVSWVVDRSSSIVNADGTVRRIVGTMRDITDRRQAEADRRQVEERLHQLQKLEAIGQLAGGVAHDFNNMLTIILVRTEMALRKVSSSDPTSASLREIHDAAERAASLTRQLLTYARRQSVTPRPLNLNAFVENALPMLDRVAGENIVVAWHPSAEPWLVELDPSQADQILVNLCLNARDALPGGGFIRLETRNVVLKEEDCRARPELAPGDHVLLSVSDTGCGMGEAVMARVFEPFFTTKEVGKGTGLGLPTVHGIMRQNHGAIEVDSAPGRGATFRVYLPRQEAARESAAQTGRAGHAGDGRETLNALPPGNGETVLIVESDPDARRLAVEILSGLGYAVLVAEDGADALRIAREHRGDIHLLMTNVEMPGMNGRELAESFGAARPRAGKLFMSGDTTMPAGTDRFVRKPFATAELAIKVRAALGAAGEGA